MEANIAIKQVLRDIKDRQQLVTVYTNPLIITNAEVASVSEDAVALTKSSDVYGVSLNHIVAIKVTTETESLSLNI